MAKQSEYTKQRNKYMKWANAQIHRGIQIQMPVIPTEKQLRAEGISGQKLAAQTRKIKKLNNPQVRATFTARDILTGETAELQSINIKRSHENREYNKAIKAGQQPSTKQYQIHQWTSTAQRAQRKYEKQIEEENEYQPYENEEEHETPDAFAQAMDILNEIINRLSHVQGGGYTYTGTAKRTSYLVQLEQHYAEMAIDVINRAIAEDGEFAVALRVAVNYEKISELVDLIVYGSDQSVMQINVRQIAEIVSGHAFSKGEAEMFDDYAEYFNEENPPS